MTPAKLDDTVCVTPQISPFDVPALVEAGFATVICNRPDDEVPFELQAGALQAACEAAGLSFVNNPLTPGGLTNDAIHAQADAIEAATGKVLAYCASGTRSAILWAFATAKEGSIPPTDIIAALDQAGYPLPGLAPQLSAFASRS